MNKNKKSFDVDWIDVVVDVDHNPLELSEGGYIFFDKNQNIEQEKILYKSKMIESQTRQTIKVKSKGSKLSCHKKVTMCTSVLISSINKLSLIF